MVLSREDLRQLKEDFHQASIGRYTVDVGWYPEMDPMGEFHCVVILDKDWDKPIKKIPYKGP